MGACIRAPGTESQTRRDLCEQIVATTCDNAAFCNNKRGPLAFYKLAIKMSTQPSPNQTEPAEIKCQLGVQVQEKTLLPVGCGLQVSEPINLAYKKGHWPGCTRKHLPRALKSSRETQLLGLRTTNARSTWAQLEISGRLRDSMLKGFHSVERQGWHDSLLIPPT